MSSILKVDAIQKADGTTPTAGDLGLNTSGTVLQVKHAKTFTSRSITATSWSSHPESTLTITPKSSTSKMFIAMGYHQNTPDGEQHGVGLFVAFNGGSFNQLNSADSNFNEVVRNTTGGTFWSQDFQFYEHDHNTTQQLEYRLYHKSRYGNQVRINDNGAGTTITVWEVEQ